MNRKATKARRQGAPPARIAWLVCFAVPLTVLLILGATRATHAHGEGEAPAISAEAELQLGEEEIEVEGECVEGAEPETGEEAEEACDEEESETSSADRCPLRSASAHAATTHTKLKITIGYTTYQPTPARVQIRNSHLETYKRHLGKSGVLRFTEKLAKTASAKVVVSIEPIGRAGCPSRRLDVRLPR
jgi:hypothetical protein